MLVATLLGSCAPPPPGCCGHTTTIARMTEYTGAIQSPSGAVTNVKVNVATNGNTSITFERGGRTIVQAFTGTSP
ncbi:MAG: hypothetical protein JNM17_20195 [Archangium sp.]|nr:hypothetical protein [Archangium sp.]